MNIEGFVLTGGASSRMGSDKARLEINGISLAERAHQTLSSICESVRAIGSASSADPLILTDIRPLPNGEHASIIGVHSALSYSGSEWTAILACDLPFVSTDLLRFLASRAMSVADGRAAVVPVQEDRKWQPLCALYRTKVCLPVVESAIDIGSLSLFRLLENLEVCFVEHREYRNLPNSDQFFLNVNTPADFERATSLIR